MDDTNNQDDTNDINNNNQNDTTDNNEDNVDESNSDIGEDQRVYLNNTGFPRT